MFSENLHPLTSLSLKLDDSNFAQKYLGVRSIFYNKSRDQIDTDVTMTSLMV